MAKLVSDAPGIKEKMEEVHEPPMSLAQLVFRHGRQPTPASEAEILGLIKERQMAPYYARVCAAFGWSRDEALYTQMAAANAAEVEALKVKLADAEENSGDMEVLDALFDAAKHRARVGDRDGAYEACDVIRDRPKISTGKRIDAVMLKIRVALFFEDVTSAKKQLEEAKGFAKDGGDWDRRGPARRCEVLSRAVPRRHRRHRRDTRLHPAGTTASPRTSPPTSLLPET
jgi:26S proteasome regulatory subunit N7